MVREGWKRVKCSTGQNHQCRFSLTLLSSIFRLSDQEHCLQIRTCKLDEAYGQNVRVYTSYLRIFVKYEKSVDERNLICMNEQKKTSTPQIVFSLKEKGDYIHCTEQRVHITKKGVPKDPVLMGKVLIEPTIAFNYLIYYQIVSVPGEIHWYNGILHIYSQLGREVHMEASCRRWECPYTFTLPTPPGGGASGLPSQ